MQTMARVMVASFLRRHPPSDLLQACADLELNSLANHLIREHLRGCELCREEMRHSVEYLDIVRPVETPASELTFLRNRIMGSIAAASVQQQHALHDLRLLLGSHALEGSADGTITHDVRTELAAFVGNRAADSFLQRLAG
jgi:predicted anti-sigma-YlaC factor YlaD